MIIIGMDQGIANFGFAVLDIDDEGFEVLESGTVRTPAKHSMGKRLIKIRTKVEELMEDYEPELMGCERLFYNAPTGGRNKSLGMMHVNMATGMLHMICTENKIELVEYPPTSVKKMVAGNGRASKEEVFNAVGIHLTKELKTEHEIDAVAIGITTYRKYREEEEKSVKDKRDTGENKTKKKKA